MMSEAVCLQVVDSHRGSPSDESFFLEDDNPVYAGCLEA